MAKKGKHAAIRGPIKRPVHQLAPRKGPPPKPVLPWRNPTFNDAGTIDVEVNHPRFGWIPFTLDPADQGAACDAEAMNKEIREKGNPMPKGAK